MKSTVVDESLSSFKTNVLFQRIPSFYKINSHSMRNLHLILLQESGIEARHLFREWERLWLRSSDYKNHRIFSLRCLHKNLIPVSIKLKSTLDTSKARQIIRKAEKDLLQARVKAINNILVQVDRQIEECRAKLASIISAERLGECQDFINKVSELRFIKVRQRQISKLNHLFSKKEGNITIANAVNNITNAVNRKVQAPCNWTLALALLPPREGSNPPPATGHLPLGGTGLPQANTQVTGSHPTPATAHLPPREGSNSLLATVHLPSEGNSSPNSQASGILPTLAIAHLPPREGSNSLPATVHPPWEGNSSPNSQASGVLPTPAIAHLPPGEGSNSLPVTVHPPLEGNSSPNSQASGSPPTPAIAHPPPGEGSNSLLGAVHLPSEDERNSSPQSSSSTHAGQGNNPPGQEGKVIGAPQAKAYTVFPGSLHHLPGRHPHPLTPQ